MSIGTPLSTHSSIVLMPPWVIADVGVPQDPRLGQPGERVDPLR